MENFFIPDELNYTLGQSTAQVNKILDDWEKINYNNYYRDNAEEIINTRFKCSNYDHIPGMNIIFQSMINKLQVSTPLEAMQKLIDDDKIFISNTNINGTNTDFLEQQKSG